MTETIERTTTANIEPNTTMFDLANALLENTEFLTCVKNVPRITIKNGEKVRQFGLPGGVWEDLLPHLKKESVSNGDIKVETVTNFDNTTAKSKIRRTFGFADFAIIGKPRHITGVRITNVVSSEVGNTEQITKYAIFIRKLKKKLPNHHVKYEKCLVTAACNTNVAKLLMELIEGKEIKP